MNDTQEIHVSEQTLAGHLPSVETICLLLADKQRRILLQYLSQQDEPAQVAEIVDHLMTITEEDGSKYTPDRRRLTISLHHIHLPKLADERFIEWNSSEGSVSLTESSEPVVSELLQCLANVSDHG